MGAPERRADEFGWFDRTAMSVLRRLRVHRRPLLVMLPLLFGLLAVPLVLPLVASALGLVLSPLVKALTMIALGLPGIAFALIFNRGMLVAARYSTAHVNGDMEEAARWRRLMEGSDPPRTAFERANRQLGDAEMLLYFERWAEARDAFAQIDRDALSEVTRPGVLGQQGYATAHAGQPELGVEEVEKAVEESEAQPDYPAGKRWFMRVRLGVALSLADRHEDAVAVLDGVLAGIDGYDGEPREWTAAQFFLGRSLRANGSVDDAMVCFDSAARHGEGPFAVRAKAALALASGAPLRDAVHMREPIALEEEAPEAASNAKRARPS